MIAFKDHVQQVFNALKLDSSVALIALLVARFLEENSLFLFVPMVIYLFLVVRVIRYIVRYRARAHSGNIRTGLYGYLTYALIGLSLTVFILVEDKLF